MDGNIFPELGAINVFGNSIKDIRKKLSNLLNCLRGVDVSVSLEALMQRKLIIGAVKNPGLSVNHLAPLHHLFHILVDLRIMLRENIVVREGKVLIRLYEFLILGSRDSDINIQQSDTS